MPSKRSITLIFFFWLSTAAFVAYRDLLPRLFASSQPTIAIDLADEAAHNVDVRWGIYRGEEQIGRLTTELKYNKEDDTFEFTCDYKDLVLEVSSFRFLIPVLQTKDTVTRGGDLRKQMARGEVDGRSFGLNGKIKASVQGTVIEGQLLSECNIDTPLGNLKEVLDPVPVTKGLPLNPLQPLNRLTSIKPGDSWFVQMRDPLKDAILKTMFKTLEQFELFQTFRKSGFRLPESKREQLVAVVLADQQELDWHGEPVTCWVIEYRQDVPVARTWVRVSDGRVMEQEAFLNGEYLKILRDR
jgi:hypothetical protein